MIDWLCANECWIPPITQRTKTVVDGAIAIFNTDVCKATIEFMH